MLAVQAAADNGTVCVRLSDGREVRFPASKNRRLRNATPEQLGNIEIICSGTGLHWPELDEDSVCVGNPRRPAGVAVTALGGTHWARPAPPPRSG